MFPYLLLIGSVSVLAITGTRNKLVFWLIALTFFVLIGWRWRVGMDWNNYTAIVERDGGKDLLTLISGVEAGFGALVWLSGQFGGVTFLNVISAAIFCIGLFAVATRCREPLLAITVASPYLVMVIAMSATRQAMALGVTFYLFSQWERFRTIGRSVIIGIAILFHFSAIVCAVFVVLGSNLSGFRRVAAAIFVGLLVLFLVTYAPERLAFYSEAYVTGRRTIESSGAFYHVALLAIPAAIYFLIRCRWIRVNGPNPLMDNLAAASVVALPAVMISSTAVDRLSLYFWPSTMYIAAGLPALLLNAEARVAMRVCICLASLGLALFWLIYANSSLAYVPYRNSLLGI